MSQFSLNAPFKDEYFLADLVFQWLSFPYENMAELLIQLRSKWIIFA
jgi:hypothetical protein